MLIIYDYYLLFARVKLYLLFAREVLSLSHEVGTLQEKERRRKW